MCASAAATASASRPTDGEHHEVGGVYREVVPNSRLVFTWAWHSTPERESLVTVTVAKDGDGTMLTLHHEQFFDEKARDGHERGWTGTLEKLERYLVVTVTGETPWHRQQPPSARNKPAEGSSRRRGRTASSTGTS